MQAARIVAANYDGKGIVESQRRHHLKSESPFVLRFHFIEYGRRTAFDGVVQDGGECGASVFDVSVNASREQGLLADEAASKIKTPLDVQVRARFEMLGENFAEQRLFGEILRSDHDSILSAASCSLKAGRSWRQ